MCELEPILTNRETEISLLVIKGLSNKKIAIKLCIAESTVKNILYQGAYKKLHISKDRELLRALIKAEYVTTHNISEILGVN